MIQFACLAPHAPLFLPDVGSGEEKMKILKTVNSLETLGKELEQLKIDKIIISAPHPDWGFNVPLQVLASGFKGEIKQYLVGLEPAEEYFKQGKEVALDLDSDKKYALIGSGDLSHVLRKDGPYGFHPDGPKFDLELINALKKKEIKNILNLNNKYPNAGECGLRSFCFILGILGGAKLNWKAEIFAYEGPFGVGYLVCKFNF